MIRDCYNCDFIIMPDKTQDCNKMEVCCHPDRKHWLPIWEITNDKMTCDKWRRDIESIEQRNKSIIKQKKGANN